jgi:hypothetical protein
MFFPWQVNGVGISPPFSKEGEESLKLDIEALVFRINKKKQAHGKNIFLNSA